VWLCNTTPLTGCCDVSSTSMEGSAFSVIVLRFGFYASLFRRSFYRVSFLTLRVFTRRPMLVQYVPCALLTGRWLCFVLFFFLGLFFCGSFFGVVSITPQLTNRQLTAATPIPNHTPPTTRNTPSCTTRMRLLAFF